MAEKPIGLVFAHGNMTIDFGKYRGRRFYELPGDYLEWLRQKDVQGLGECAAAVLAEREYVADRLRAGTSSGIDYIITFEGGLAPEYEGEWGWHDRRFDSYDEALKWLTEEVESRRLVPSPEHDRILIWEVLPSGHRKVVWHYSGWHWNPYEHGLNQGALLGHEESLYEEAVIEYMNT